MKWLVIILVMLSFGCMSEEYCDRSFEERFPGKLYLRGQVNDIAIYKFPGGDTIYFCPTEGDMYTKCIHYLRLREQRYNPPAKEKA